MADTLEIRLGSLNDLPQPLMAAELGNELMKGIVAGDEFLVSAPCGRPLLQEQQVAQMVNCRFVNIADSQTDALALQGAADEVPLLETLAVDMGHIGAELGPHIEKPLLRQEANGVAHRRARDAETIGDVLLYDHGARSQAERYDGMAKDAVNLVADRQCPVYSRFLGQPRPPAFRRRPLHWRLSRRRRGLLSCEAPAPIPIDRSIYYSSISVLPPRANPAGPQARRENS